MLKVCKRNVKSKLRNYKEKVKVIFWKDYNDYVTSLFAYNKLVKYWQAGNELETESWKLESWKRYCNIHFT